MSAFAASLMQLLPNESTVDGPLENSLMFRVNEVQSLTPIVYKPSIYFVAQGEKEAWLEDKRYVYNTGQFLLLTVPLPLHCRVIEASEDTPFLAAKLNIDLSILKDVLTQMPSLTKNAGDQSHSGMAVSTMTDSLQDCVHRFFNTLAHPDQQAVLAPMIYREILFHLLQGPEAIRLLEFATAERHSNRISKAIDFIHLNYKQSIRVEELAAIAAMSESTFFEHFKTVTRLTPLQYVKNIRLHQAKHQIFVERLPVNEAAFQVGYESASQFSREYKRLFGLSPAQHLKAG